MTRDFRVVVWAAVLFLSVATARAAEDPTPRLLTSQHDREFLAANLLDRQAWRPFPPASDRKAWDALLAAPLNQARRDWLVGRAESLLGQPWPALPATLYMEYARQGNRTHYQIPYFQRRENLATLVLAECLEYRGRFLDEIVNGVWAICEESTWCVPAHATRRARDTLHRLDVEGLDLFACETGASLAQTLYLLQKELDRVSPTVGERIRREVGRRILDPYAAGDRFGASGWIAGGNNWAPWCSSNILVAALCLEEDRQRLAAVVFRLMRVVDRFIDRYGEDGGCNEGPSYWDEAGGAMLVFLELLHSRTGGKIDIFGHPKIAAMGRYIASAQLDGPWFANFADADTKPRLTLGKIYRFGERTGCEALKNLALLSMRQGQLAGPIDPPLRVNGVVCSLLGPLMEMFWIPPDAQPAALDRPLTVWLPDLQVLFARQSPRPGQGLVLAAKGGHNAESHNHNDLGHFILLLDGQPGIIDLGREEYTQQTFGKQRYELLFTRGLGHNGPVIDGTEQRAGREFRATQVEFQEQGPTLCLGMNLEQAYPKTSGLRALRREFLFDRRTESVEVRDRVERAQEPAKVAIHLYAAQPVKQLAPGALSIGCTPRPLLLDYDSDRWDAAVEVVPLQDRRLQEAWGERLYHIRIESKAAEAAAISNLRFRPGKVLQK